MRLKPFVIWLFRSHWHFFYTQLSSDGFSSHRTYEVSESESESRSVVSDSLRPMDYTVHGIPQARILQWESLFLLQGIFPTQGSNPDLPHCRWILYQLSHKGSPRILEWVAYPFSSQSSHPRKWTRVSCIAGGFFTSWGTLHDELKNFPCGWRHWGTATAGPNTNAFLTFPLLTRSQGEKIDSSWILSMLRHEEPELPRALQVAFLQVHLGKTEPFIFLLCLMKKLSSMISFLVLSISLYTFGCPGSSLLWGLFSSCSEQGYSLVMVHRLLAVVASLVEEHRLNNCSTRA